MSANLSKRIAKGDVGAYKELYNRTKERVWYINYLLLCDEASANESTKAVYKTAFSDIALRPEEADNFSEFIEKKTVSYCRIKLSKNNNKEFQIPASKNFMSFECNEKTLVKNEREELLVLANMPAIQRFIFVCGAYLKWNDKQIAQVLHTTADTVTLARGAEEANVERISRVISSANQKGAVESVEVLALSLYRLEGSFDVDFDIEKSIFAAAQDSAESTKAKSKKKSKKNLLTVAIIVATLVLIIGVVCCVALFGRPKRDYTPPYSNEADITHYATIDVDGYGEIKLALCGNIAPETVANFEKLANDGFYDGLTFHRIMEGFMMQGGCPEGTGLGGNRDENGKEITIKGEFAANGHENNISHKRGVISMARNGYSYDSGSSQFFIVHENTERLDGSYAAFGYVVEGMHVVDFVCEDSKPTDDNGTISRADQPKINSIRVEAVK